VARPVRRRPGDPEPKNPARWLPVHRHRRTAAGLLRAEPLSKPDTPLDRHALHAGGLRVPHQLLPECAGETAARRFPEAGAGTDAGHIGATRAALPEG
jgi:hypothetical protein